MNSLQRLHEVRLRGLQAAPHSGCRSATCKPLCENSFALAGPAQRRRWRIQPLWTFTQRRGDAEGRHGFLCVSASLRELPLLLAVPRKPRRRGDGARRTRRGLGIAAHQLLDLAQQGVVARTALAEQAVGVVRGPPRRSVEVQPEVEALPD